ncbi:cytochrome c-type biogenesis protein CcmF [Filimonas lacunae]|uniref:Cytochrome c-type biogenesis protein CcmF n=1 Tax=Filimonas lacunae TaxID=477680 RepID=A0A173MJN3_9BACT|nr:cytochrome c biogenesis protein CcsA [Filimonas lacunae]BAV07852.1 cytochrome c heme lyase subunit CcmF [Filimonas lacunae]SIT05633.1 cytochrome c-type biogenesis protein CcmF [Filimonas lacunae]
MNYIGEHLLPGKLGHFFAVLSLVASLVATIAYYKASKSALPQPDQQSWLRLARLSFLVETVSVLGMFITIYFIVSHHYNEYYFAWNHSSRSLQPEYLLSCIWEDQSGSFLLWSIWHCVLGWVFIWRNKKWEAPVLTVINVAQFCIATMLLGIYVLGYKIGNNPFILFREQMPNLPLFANPHYLSLPRVHEGNDLNTLLQNYWMVIHPPVLFLGFASTIIPFGFAYAGMVKRDASWTSDALSWSSFSAAILGTGIMMGAAWAYESLSFGGYWAWDPVENASLVPWLTLVAGIHTNLVFKSSGYSLKSTYLFYIITWVLVLYSSFLTKSGVLGDTSVHAFTDSGTGTQLVLFVLLFFIPGMVLFFKEYKHMPTIQKEENTYSREFWMFIGALVLFLSSIVIIAKTSVPLVNKIFHTQIAPPEDPEFAHNQIQVFIAFIIGILTAVTQYFKYKDTSKQYFGKKIWLPTLIALIISVAISLFGEVHYDKKGPGFLIAIHLSIFAAVYAVVANASYIFQVLKGNVKAAGASVAHVGFGLVLVGVLISSSKKTILSWNTTGVSTLQGDGKENPAENITLFKGVKTDMGKYHVTYVTDSLNPYDRKKYFELQFENKKTGETFNLYPDVLKNNKGMEGYSPNPDSKHYWNKDIFVYISSWLEGKQQDTAAFTAKAVKAGDTLFYSNGVYILNKVEVNPSWNKRTIQPGETAMMLDFTVITKDGRHYGATPGIAINGDNVRNLPDTVGSQGLILQFNKVLDGGKGRLEIGMKEDKTMNDLLTLKVYEFPFINILWIGVLVMVIGFLMSVGQRLRLKN